MTTQKGTMDNIKAFELIKVYLISSKEDITILNIIDTYQGLKKGFEGFDLKGIINQFDGMGYFKDEIIYNNSKYL